MIYVIDDQIADHKILEIEKKDKIIENEFIKIKNISKWASALLIYKFKNLMNRNNSSEQDLHQKAEALDQSLKNAVKKLIS